MVKKTARGLWMTEKQIESVKTLLSRGVKSKLRNLFYQKNGLPKQGLLSNADILDKLGISEMNPNTLEHEGIMRVLGSSLAKIRSQAKDAGLPWIDIEIIADGKKLARHGYDSDIDKIMANASKYDEIASTRKRIAKQTRKIAERVRIAANS